MNLYVTRWLEDRMKRKRVLQLGFNQSSDKFSELVTSSPNAVLVSAVISGLGSPWLPRAAWTRSLRLQDNDAGSRWLGREHPPLQQRPPVSGEKHVCVQLNWGTFALRRPEGSTCWLPAQVAAPIFIWAAPLTLFNELWWVSFPV